MPALRGYIRKILPAAKRCAANRSAGRDTGLSSPYGFHDWEFILQETRLLRCDHFLANLAKALGTVLMIGALAWGLGRLHSFQTIPEPSHIQKNSRPSSGRLISAR